MHASPTISISNLQYPSTLILGKQVTASFTVAYSGVTPNINYLVAGITKSELSDWATGSVISSGPDNCPTDPYRTWAASCLYQPKNTDGSENVAFSIIVSSVGTYSFDAEAEIVHYSTSNCPASTSYVCLDAFSRGNPVPISIRDKFTVTIGIADKVSVTLDGTQENPGYISLQLSPGTHTISVPNIVQIDSTSRLRFSGWLDGSNQTTRTVDLEEDTNFGATYVTQYLVTANSESTLGSGWYDQGTVVQTSVNTSQPLNSYRVLVDGFDGWYNGAQLVSKATNASLTVNGPLNLTAKWNYLPYVPPVMVVVIVGGLILLLRRADSLSTVGFPKLTRRRRSRRRSKRTTRPRSPTTSVAENALPTVEQIGKGDIEMTDKNGDMMMFCPQCGARISRNSKLCKECGFKL